MAVDADPRRVLARAAFPASRNDGPRTEPSPGPARRLRRGRPAALTPIAPLVLLHGADDGVVLPKVSRCYANRVRASGRAHAEVRRIVIPACNHFALIDPEHAAFAVALDSVRSRAP